MTDTQKVKRLSKSTMSSASTASAASSASTIRHSRSSASTASAASPISLSLSRTRSTSAKQRTPHSQHSQHSQSAFFTDPTIQMKAIPSSKQSKRYTANKELSELAHRIYRGENINANIPPKNITYDILFNEIGSELELDIGLGRDLGLGLGSLYLQTKTKEELRLEWWKIWHRIIASNSAKSANAAKQRKSANAAKHPKKQIAGNPSKKEVEEELARIQEESEIELLEIKKEILKMQEALRIRRINYASRIRTKIQGMSHGDIMGLIDKGITYPTIKTTKLYQANKRFHIYGMQLPHQFDRIALLQTFFYLLKNKKIYNIVDLHDCVNGTNEEHPYSFMGIGCNPYDSHAEPETWALAVEKYKTIKPELNANFYNVIGYEDMTKGSLSAWNMISTIKDTTVAENSVVIHCLAGAGRTGSAMLYLLLRDSINIIPNKQDVLGFYLKRIGLPHFGFKDINEFIHYSKEQLFTIKDSNTEFMKKEFFKVSKLAYASLLRQRMNYILFFLARHYNVRDFYTYGRPTKELKILPDDEFSNPCRRTITDWRTVDNKTVLPWFD